MLNKIEQVLNNVKSACNLTGDVRMHTEKCFTVYYIIDEGLVQSWVSSIQSTLIGRIKQAVGIEPIDEFNNMLKFNCDGRMYDFSVTDCFDGNDRVILVVGAVIDW